MPTALLPVGGGSRGFIGAAYLEQVIEQNIHWDAIYSSSVGTLNGLLTFQGRNKELKDIWMNIKTSKVYTPRLFFGSDSLYDSTPLREIITKYTDIPRIRAIKDKKFYISTTSFVSGKAVIFEINDLADHEIVDVLLASASPPVFFPPIKFRDDVLVDSGISNNFGLTSAINGGYDTLFVLKYPRGKMKHVLTPLDGLSNVLVISTDSDYDREVAAINKINKIVDNCNNPDTKHIKLVEICTDTTDADYDFLDFDFHGIDREALWQRGKMLAKKVLNKELA